MQPGDVVRVNISPNVTVYGSVGTIHNGRRVSITVETKDIVGFSPISTHDFTLRNNGKWIRVGVNANTNLWTVI